MKLTHKISHAALTTAILLALSAGSAWAMPTGATTVAGNVSGLTGAGAVLTDNGGLTGIIKAGAAANIINWQEFCLAANETLKFDTQTGAILNRVVGNNVSELLGHLQQEGQYPLLLVNPHGIIVGQSAVIDASQLVLSTLDITDEAFQAGVKSGTYDFVDGDKSQGLQLQAGAQLNVQNNLVLAGAKIDIADGVTFAFPAQVQKIAGSQVVVEEPIAFTHRVDEQWQPWKSADDQFDYYNDFNDSNGSKDGLFSNDSVVVRIADGKQFKPTFDWQNESMTLTPVPAAQEVKTLAVKLPLAAVNPAPAAGVKTEPAPAETPALTPKTEPTADTPAVPAVEPKTEPAVTPAEPAVVPPADPASAVSPAGQTAGAITFTHRLDEEYQPWASTDNQFNYYNDFNDSNGGKDGLWSNDAVVVRIADGQQFRPTFDWANESMILTPVAVTPGEPQSVNPVEPQPEVPVLNMDKLPPLQLATPAAQAMLQELKDKPVDVAGCRSALADVCRDIASAQRGAVLHDTARFVEAAKAAGVISQAEGEQLTTAAVQASALPQEVASGTDNTVHSAQAEVKEAAEAPVPETAVPVTTPDSDAVTVYQKNQ